MDSQTTPGTLRQRPNNSWGAIISILLILAIVVIGAYYAFTDRVAPTPAAEVPTGY
jgi:hypothetical protein